MSAHSHVDLLSNHGRLLAAVARTPRATMRELGDAVGITERAAHRLMADLCAEGYVDRQREGRCNVYEVDDAVPADAVLALASASGSRPSQEPSAR